MRPRFIADCNVGRLARWLRALGYDVEYHAAIGDRDLVRVAVAADRVLLTRDVDLTQRRVIRTGLLKTVLLRQDGVEDQLRQVVHELGLGSELALSRCIECNVELEARAPEVVADRVPPYVWATQQRYCECPRCNRVYWAGTHWSRMRQRLESALSGA